MAESKTVTLGDLKKHVGVTIKDNSPIFANNFKKGMTVALYAIGVEAERIILDYMTNRYYKDIHLTGDLKRDLNYQVDLGEQVVHIGNSLKYGTWVHQGTSKMPSRPYLKDAVSENREVWNKIFEQYLELGLEGKVSTTSMITYDDLYTEGLIKQ